MIKKIFLIFIFYFFLVYNSFSMTVPPIPFKNTEYFDGGSIGINALFQCLFQSEAFCKLIHDKSTVEEPYYFQAIEQIRNSIKEQEIFDLSALNAILTDETGICELQNPFILLLNLLRNLEIPYSHYFFENGYIYDLQNQERLIEFGIDFKLNFEIIIIPILDLIILCPSENFIISDSILNNLEIFCHSFFNKLKKLYQHSTNYFHGIDFETIGYIQKIERHFIAFVKHKESFYQCNDETDTQIGVIEKIDLSNYFENFFDIFYLNDCSSCMLFLEITKMKNQGAIFIYPEIDDIVNEIKERLKILNINYIGDLSQLIELFGFNFEEVNKIAEIILCTPGAVIENTSILTQIGIDILASYIAKISIKI